MKKLIFMCLLSVLTASSSFAVQGKTFVLDKERSVLVYLEKTGTENRIQFLIFPIEASKNITRLQVIPMGLAQSIPINEELLTRAPTKELVFMTQKGFDTTTNVTANMDRITGGFIPGLTLLGKDPSGNSIYKQWEDGKTVTFRKGGGVLTGLQVPLFSEQSVLVFENNQLTITAAIPSWSHQVKLTPITQTDLFKELGLN